MRHASSADEPGLRLLEQRGVPPTVCTSGAYSPTLPRTLETACTSTATLSDGFSEIRQYSQLPVSAHRFVSPYCVTARVIVGAVAIEQAPATRPLAAGTVL